MRVPRSVMAGVIAACVIGAGCTRLPPVPATEDIEALGQAVRGLGVEVTEAEAGLLARAAHDQARALAARYRTVRPAALHNCFVNSGFRERGVCYHWAEDLRAALQSLDLPHLELHWAEARAGTRREHNAVVVTARGQAFGRGLVLDAWRRSGRLVWGPVGADRYPWRPLAR